MQACLVLKDGSVFEGESFGYEGLDQNDNILSEGEVVFNTAMSGYQETFTDPSYKGQILCLTYPEIGNVGMNSEDQESDHPQISALIVKNYQSYPSNFRSQSSLADYLKKYKIPALQGIDTRALVKHLRDRGAQPGLIALAPYSIADLKKKAKKCEEMTGKDWVQAVTCQKAYTFKEGLWRYSWQKKEELPEKKLKVIAYDFGIKRNILRCLVSSGFDVKVVPAHTSAQEVLKENCDGVFLSNGPGDPAAVHYAIENIAQLRGNIPLFGICLGHQILALSLGAKTFKLKFGHRGVNQPVIDLATQKVEITSQNHGFAVEEESLKKIAQLSHLNLNDKTVEGLCDFDKKFFSVQYHPEASPGPHDSFYLFQRFRKMILEEEF